jgi:hypothetical protein
VLADGPAVSTLLETITAALADRGLTTESTTWDAWRNEDGRWIVKMGWQAGLSENVAHFRFSPGAHGGTVTAIDESASELVDPDFKPPLRPVAPVAQLSFEEPAVVIAPAPAAVIVPAVVAESVPVAAPLPLLEPELPLEDPQPQAEVQQPAARPQPRTAAKRSSRKPAIPAWEDVLLGVRTSGER